MRTMLSKPRSKMSVTYKLLLLFIFMVSPIFILTYYGNLTAEHILKQTVTNAYLELNKQNLNLVNRDIDSIDLMTKTIIQNPLTQHMIPSGTDSILERVSKYEALDKLLKSYSIGVNGGEAVYFSLYVYDPADYYSFAPKDRSAPQAGVYFLTEQDKPDWFLEALRMQGKGSLKVIDSMSSMSQSKTLSYVRAVNNISQASGVIGVLVVTKLEKIIQNDFSTVSLPQGEIFLTDWSNQIFASTAEGVGSILELPDRAKEIERKDGYLDIIHSGHIYVINYSYHLQQKLVYRLPLHSLLQQQSQLKQIIQFISIVYALLVFAAFIYFWRSLMNPMQKLSRFIRSYTPGKHAARQVEGNRNDELGALITSVYDMADRLNHLVNDKYQYEIKQKEAQLQILYQQINPHLLYNTLESIYWKSMLEGSTQSAEMIKDLAKLMKIGLSRGRELITIEEELAHALAYISLQQRRYEFRFRVVWNISDEVRHLQIPKITLQPLIENAIIHGVKNMEDDGEIVVSADIQSDIVIIRVEDNGYKEVDYEEIHRLLNEEMEELSVGYGIRNIQQRIKLHFGCSYGISYSKREHQGTIVTITLPKSEVTHGKQILMG
ncbi:integral membrane sensor signal transduction histidine kinase [Paenibacillus sp. NAIST15-1]|nr:integral membrane sensor signal transduction histidine kinase [Paenibacillus sp. NAIST15-1]